MGQNVDGCCGGIILQVLTPRNLAGCVDRAAGGFVNDGGIIDRDFLCVVNINFLRSQGKDQPRPTA
jgi:hypothetical protein